MARAQSAKNSAGGAGTKGTTIKSSTAASRRSYAEEEKIYRIISGKKKSSKFDEDLPF